MTLWWASIRAKGWDETHCVVLSASSRGEAAQELKRLCRQAGVTMEEALLVEVAPRFQSWARRHKPAELDRLLGLARGIPLRASTVAHALDLLAVRR